MDVDPPPLTLSTLKRSSSAPMINVLGNTSPSFRESPPPQLLLSVSRTRRFSASFSPNHNCFSPNSPGSSGVATVVPTRVSQIKQEEGMDMLYREAAHEKETQSKIQISQSWEDLTLEENISPGGGKRPCSITDPLHIFTAPVLACGFSSPTRSTGKQCYSPSMCQPVKTSPFSPSPSPSPTRKTFTTRRSQSPIALRPSQFSVKRKFPEDMDASPAKRSHPDRPLLITHPLVHSSLNAAMDSSPDQTVPHEGADITDSMSSSSGSPCGTFKPVDTAIDLSCGMEEASV